MKKPVFIILAVILVTLLGVTGCGKSETTSAPSTTIYSQGTANYDGKPGVVTPTITLTQPQPVQESSDFFGLGKGGDSTAPIPTVTITGTDPDSYGYSGITIPTERMVIKNANMALVVEDVTVALQQITDLAAANGGYVINSDIREDRSRVYANIYFRVDSDKFNATLHSLHSIAVDVRSESTSGQDVTEEFVDLEAKLRNLEASETQLLVLMEKAGTVEEILKVQQQLVSTRSDIEQIKGRMQYLEQASSLSSIYVSLEQSKLTVEFFAYASTVKEGEKVGFSPTISGGFEPYSFEWNFGDGDTSTEGAPLHSYKKDGVYTVSVTVKDDKGITAFAERKDYITVLTGWDAGNTASSAWNGLVGFGRFLGSLFIWLGILSPIWIGILVILYFAWWRRRKKKA